MSGKRQQTQYVLALEPLERGETPLGGGLTPAVSVRRSVHRDHVICLDCGYRGKTLTRHIAARHGLSADEYASGGGYGAINS